ncbi:MAG: hypothetical protein AB8B65_16105 [Kordia sp.]|uniref:hypothetical protein n=1 Tax=Kordia sp. TaxID=1965332 RepID=UPI0038580C84
MKTIKLKNAFLFGLLFAIVSLKAQEKAANKMIEIEFQTIEKESNTIIIAAVIEVLSDGKRVGITHGDYDGIAKIKFCSDKLTKEQITLNVYGMKCKPFQSKYTIHTDSKIKIHLEYGQTKYQTLKDRMLILLDLNVPINDIEVVELENDSSYYRHCDGRLKQRNEIPKSELSEWKRVEN